MPEYAHVCIIGLLQWVCGTAPLLPNAMFQFRLCSTDRQWFWRPSRHDACLYRSIQNVQQLVEGMSKPLTTMRNANLAEHR
jgi:hypothetical protein